MSETRIKPSEIQFLLYPAINPIGTPIRTDTPIAITAMAIVILAPNNMREKISEPILSVPKKCDILGPSNRSGG